MLTIVFYTNEGAAAKMRSRQLVATNKGDVAKVIDAGFWDGEANKCDVVEIMPDVPGWQRKRILEAFGEDKVKEMEYGDPNEEQEQQEQPDAPVETKKQETVEKKAVHRGGGRWFVMTNDEIEIISGPHDKSEALRLAAEEQAHVG